MKGIHQVLAGAAPFDAITNHVLAAREVIRDMGIHSEIFVEARHRDPSLVEICHPIDDWARRTSPGDAAIAHYSIDSPAFSYAADRASLLAIHYHNITPPELLWRYAPRLARQCAEGRTRLGALVKQAATFAADSEFNAGELRAEGAGQVAVVGILRQAALATALRSGARIDETRMLFVGRGVPNKAQDELILSAASLRQIGCPVRLRLVGAWGAAPAFARHCLNLIGRLGAEPYVDLLGPVDDAALAREYASADVFACLSRHEGYCVPLIEAMEANLPVVARAAGAVPETLGRGGLVLDDPRPSEMAEAILLELDTANDPPRITGRATQLSHHSHDATAARLRAFISEMA